MWELGHKEDWEPKNWWFRIVVLEKTLESSLDCKEIKSFNPKGNLPWNSSEGQMLKLKLQYFDQLMGRTNSLEKILMLGKAEGNRRRGQERMNLLDSITNSMDMNLSKLWKTVEDRRAWCATAHGIAKSRTRLSDWTTSNLDLATLLPSSLMKPLMTALSWGIISWFLVLICRKFLGSLMVLV